MKTKTAEELWDDYSQHIDSDIDSLNTIAGTSIITKKDFMKAMEEYANQSKWVSMETAPKDGTEILVYDTQEGIMLVAWDTEEIHYPGCKGRKCWCVPGSHQDEQGGAYTSENATHWQPLPEKPHP